MAVCWFLYSVLGAAGTILYRAGTYRIVVVVVVVVVVGIVVH